MDFRSWWPLPDDEGGAVRPSYSAEPAGRVEGEDDDLVLSAAELLEVVLGLTLTRSALTTKGR
ncbi:MULTISPECIES: hypothetical protein [unclassified Streptomyces]|uniref:hypothetical protein n=1 Tax=unclassified Streptomyces TaxID=2593676 RepID=UPI0022501A97|nr:MULTISPECIES: hypothetical protein [unclassified Streptomyces]MCX4527186.1 hypothetical protein [Streptomyces sp. NBC_01551]MCX4542238.1 hypothetical protein [Streptomyces sp. NBC_01565]